MLLSDRFFVEGVHALHDGDGHGGPQQLAVGSDVQQVPTCTNSMSK